jgi:phosphoribosyl-ATP pyrophosphohydrolase
MKTAAPRQSAAGGAKLANQEKQETVSDTENIFSRLMAVIESRKTEAGARSYTAKLLAGGVPKIGEKISEEAAEVVEAAGEEGSAGQEHLVKEAADVIYHLFVMLALREVPLSQVEAELTRRFGTSGLDEKASRGQGGH